FPEIVKSVATDGDGGPGTTQQLNFIEGGQLKFMKEVVDEVDEVKLIYGYTVFGGDTLVAGVEKISYRMTMEESAVGGGGTSCKRTTKFFTSEDGGIGEDEIKAAYEGMRQQFSAVFKGFESYLLAHPSS
ncbi:unnamed protein product, partial [Linum tenue]